MDTNDSKQFLEEREARIGGKITYKAYATWFAELGRERRDFGVFVYSDGNTLVIEDFFRPATVLGYEFGGKREEQRRNEYVKLIIDIPVKEIESVSYVSRPSIEASLRAQKDKTNPADIFSRIFTKNATMVKAGGRTFFLEFPSHKAFAEYIETNRRNAE